MECKYNQIVAKYKSKLFKSTRTDSSYKLYELTKIYSIMNFLIHADERHTMHGAKGYLFFFWYPILSDIITSLCKENSSSESTHSLGQLDSF